jgi:tubulin polyglutamylase TTLL1
LDGQNIKCDFLKTVLPKIKGHVTDTFKAVSRKMDPDRRNCSFEIFGYDFMIDEELKPWLIEVNTNPCLELSSPYLARLIPAMLENAIK